MVHIIPGRIENGHIVPVGPLPPVAQIRDVSIVLQTDEPDTLRSDKSTFELLYGLARGYSGDPREDYRQHLEEKYR